MSQRLFHGLCDAPQLMASTYLDIGEEQAK